MRDVSKPHEKWNGENTRPADDQQECVCRFKASFTDDYLVAI